MFYARSRFTHSQVLIHWADDPQRPLPHRTMILALTLTPNPAVDVTYLVPALAPGGSRRVAEARERAGGKGVNAAGVLASMGRRSTVVAPVGVSNLAAFGDDRGARGTA